MAEPIGRCAEMESSDERIAREANEHFGRSAITPWTVARVKLTHGGNFYSKIDRWIWDRLVAAATRPSPSAGGNEREG